MADNAVVIRFSKPVPLRSRRNTEEAVADDGSWGRAVLSLAVPIGLPEAKQLNRTLLVALNLSI